MLKMLALKIWQLLVMALPGYLYGFAMGVEIQPCYHAVRDEACNITCHTQDYVEVITIKCNGTSRGTCLTVGCGPNMYQEGGNTVYLHIPSLSYTSDNCEWTCTYGATSSSASTYTIYSGISSKPNLTSQENANGVKLTAIAECLYPSSPNVDVQYSEVFAGQYVSLTQQVDLKSSISSSGCSYAIESRVTAISDVPAYHADLEGKSVFFKMTFSQYPSGPVTDTNVLGPFSFKDCFLDIFLCGFLPVFLIVIIVSIVLIIILLKECLPKQFGELTKKKFGIIVTFTLVAIIIGVCLGLLIKGCDKKFLALGLSILFAIIIVVAFILILFFYHKKFESRKGSQGGQGQDNNGFSLDSCFRKCKVRPEKEMDNSNNTSSTATKAPIGRTRESQNNTGSNTTKNATERVGNKAGVPKGEQSALKQKEINTPLPSPPSQPQTAFAHNLPMSRTNQLPPLAKENEEANTVEKKKKKKKKKRKKSEEAGENVDKIQDDDNDN